MKQRRLVLYYMPNIQRGIGCMLFAQQKLENKETFQNVLFLPNFTFSQNIPIFLQSDLPNNKATFNTSDLQPPTTRHGSAENLFHKNLN